MFAIGDIVRIMHMAPYHARPFVMCYGGVVRITRTQIIVCNQHNNISRFKLDGNCLDWVSNPLGRSAIRHV